MAWSAKTTQSSVSIGTPTGTATTNSVTLSPNESADIQIERTDVGTTDDLIVQVQSTLDDTSETWDDHPMGQFRMNPSDGGALSFTVSRLYKFRLKLDGSGVTDTIVIDFSYRKDGISL